MFSLTMLATFAPTAKRKTDWQACTKIQRNHTGGLAMREKFEAWFTVNYPGMALNGPTASGEFITWAAGCTAGMEEAIATLNSILALQISKKCPHCGSNDPRQKWCPGCFHEDVNHPCTGGDICNDSWHDAAPPAPRNKQVPDIIKVTHPLNPLIDRVCDIVDKAGA
jgi:hypothetical protein